ncbi:Hypothetical predicted protein, partial [Paramuricea clavata]
REVKSLNQNLHLISPQTISILTPKLVLGKIVKRRERNLSPNLQHKIPANKLRM